MSPLEISAMPKRAPARCDAPSVTRLPRSNILGLTVNPCAKLTSPITPPEQALFSSPILRGHLICLLSAPSASTVALPIKPPLAVVPLTVSACRSRTFVTLTMAPVLKPTSPTTPPAEPFVDWTVAVGTLVRVPMLRVAPSLTSPTSRPALPELVSTVPPEARSLGNVTDSSVKVPFSTVLAIKPMLPVAFALRFFREQVGVRL